MSFNIADATEIALNVFGGLVSEPPASNCPEGSSPDNQDCQFWPGAVGSRAGLQKVFTSALGDVTVTYAKSYVDPLGIIRNLYLDSDGNLWVENVTASSGTVTLLMETTPGSYAKSITAFGREYIAISDKLHGADIPLQYDGTNLDRVTQDGPGSPPLIENVVIPATAMDVVGGFTLQRTTNVVLVNTATPHGLQVGYRAQISNVGHQAVNFISRIVVDNANTPGRATITLPDPHGLASGEYVEILYVPAAQLDPAAALSRQGEVVTAITAVVANPPLPGGHNLSPGGIFTISGAANASFNGTFVVRQVVDINTFTYIQAGADATTTGVLSINWPFTGPAVESLWQILSVPDANTFQVAINYPSGIWEDAGSPPTGSAGAVYKPWNGTFFVKEVIDAQTFTYFDPGPDGISADIGTVTPTGQSAPGEHQMQVLFLTRQGYVTKPSPPVRFIANGGQYLHVTDIPIGPANVRARILAFTGARGAAFYYIPVPAMLNGQTVSTATQVDDNTATEVTLDFSDNTLYAALAINIMGNNLPAQIVIDGALGFGYFGSRLITYGQRNRIQNLLNMAFDGGYFPSDVTMPTGWIGEGSPADPGGALTTDARFGQAWETDGGGGSIYQSFYLDAYGAPIATPRARYSARVWIKGTGSITLTISSVDTGFTSTVTLTGTSADGSFIDGAFNTQMPNEIPADMILSVEGTAGAIVDEISIIYTETPFLDRILYGSYVNNPEAFDGLSGKFGPANDTRKVMTFGLIRGALFLLTRDPTGRLHAVLDNGVTEPAGWSINELGTNCGCVSAFGLTVSQADDATGGGGEEWFAWASYAGARIFGGDQPWKISQEIQPDWNNINPAAALTIWACNDPLNRVIYFGLPVGVATAPNLIYPVDYKHLDTAYQIGQSGPIYRTQGGRMASGEFSRKWTRWNLTMNGAALMYRQDTSALYLNLFAGNGVDPATPGSPPEGGFGNTYILCPGQLTDDDFGQIFWYYVTYFFPSHQLEAVLGLGSHRKTLEYFQYLASGVGQLRVSFLCNALDNVWPLNCVRDLSLDPQFDIEHPGSSATGQRIAFKFEALPAGSV